MSKADFFIIRHGESVGNVDPEVYLDTPDHKVPLTQEGIKQARAKREELLNLLHGYKFIYSWVSPYTRTQETAQHMFPEKELREKNLVVNIRQDPRIREQEWGTLNSMSDRDKLVAERKRVGHFFYRFPNGESGADVYDRSSHFLESVFRNHKLEGPKAANVIFTHGLTGRVLAMRLMHTPYEEFEAWDNPRNCQIIKLERRPGGYVLDEKYGVEKWK
jgi:broad specificity phosphatase PhoE